MCLTEDMFDTWEKKYNISDLTFGQIIIRILKSYPVVQHKIKF